MVSPTRHSCESRNPGPKVSAEALDPRFAGRRKKNVPAHLPRRRPHGLAEAGITHQDVDHLIIYDAPCLLPGGKLCASADLRPRRSVPGTAAWGSLKANGGGLS